MMKLLPRFLLVVMIMLAAGCGKKRPGHGGILSYNDMKLVMWDMAQADEYAAVYLKRDTTKNLQTETNRVYQQIFLLHKTDSAQFFNSFRYYKTHPDHYKVLLDSLNAIASRDRNNRFYINTMKPVAPVRKVQNHEEP